ncbi:MAG: hypothetical protein ACF8XB_23890 [Planctomycetota bacterium JB042]
MKKLLILLLLLVVGGVVGVGMFAGTAIEKGVETGGSWAFGSDTALGGASLNLLGGSVGLNELTVANPQGFSEGNAIRVGDLGVKTDVGSLMSDVIEVEFIDIASPELTLELSTGGTNLGALLDHLDERAKSLSSGESKPEPAPEDDGKPGKKLKVGRVTIDGAKVHLKQSVLLSGGTTVELPKLELKDIGGGGDSVTLPQLFEQILGAIMAATAKTGALPADLQGLLDREIAKEALANVRQTVDRMSGELKKAAEGLSEGLEKGVEGIADEGKKAVDDLKEGLGGLLGGDEKEKKKKNKKNEDDG